MLNNFGMFNGFGPGMTTLLYIALIWNLVWKGFALWKAAGNKDKWWFIAILFINTMGLLEIIYIFVILKQREAEKKLDEVLAAERI